MDASELFRVMEKVPREAWPPCSYSKRSECFENGYGFVHEELAELLFVGSMVKWLQSLAFIVEMYYEHQDGRTRVMLNGSGAIEHKMAMETVFRGKSAVEALALACAAVPAPVAGDEAYKREAMAWRRYMQYARDHELIVFRVRSQHASESECAVFQTFTALELKLYEAQDAVDAAASSAKSAAGRGEDEDAGR